MPNVRLAIAALLGASAMFVTSQPQLAAESFDTQRTYSAPVDRVYAAELQAAGAMLKRSVERSCTVQFQTNEAVTTYYRVMNWKATCRNAPSGGTTVTLEVQVQSTIVWGNEEAKQKVAAQFWSDMDKVLAQASAPSAAPPTPAISSPHPAAEPSPAPPATGTASSATGLAHITSEPSGAEIEVDGEYAGNTPSDLKLKAGAHNLKISKKGFAPWQHAIKIDSGESRTF
ncbi:MAG: PEGA domain-containing protein, partial [Terriglobales bacterium]